MLRKRLDHGQVLHLHSQGNGQLVASMCSLQNEPANESEPARWNAGIVPRRDISQGLSPSAKTRLHHSNERTDQGFSYPDSDLPTE